LASPRVHLFMDYQNVHLSVLEAFAPAGTPLEKVLVHPGKFADQIMAERAKQGRMGDLAQIHVYRGRPSPDKEPTLASLNDAQRSRWLWDKRVTVHSRPLRYPSDWPQQRAREKGVDVMLACDFVRHAVDRRADVLILASRDTDLVPALEMAADCKDVTVEVATWQNTSRLRFPSGTLWCTWLDGNRYLESKDSAPYSTAAMRRIGPAH
jgi:uncharacterized LabA/DUF88 family protein